MNIFDIVKSIRTKKEIYSWDEISKEYVPFIVNRALSFDMQEVLLANEVNKNIPPEWAYSFLKNAIERNTRFVKWIKQEKPFSEDTLRAIADVYQCSFAKAIDIHKILTEEQIEQLISRGGRAPK